MSPDPLHHLSERVSRLEAEMAQIRGITSKLDEIHTAFFKPIRPHKPALIDRLYAIADTTDNAIVAKRFLIKTVLTIGGIAAAITATIKLYLINGGQS